MRSRQLKRNRGCNNEKKGRRGSHQRWRRRGRGSRGAPLHGRGGGLGRGRRVRAGLLLQGATARLLLHGRDGGSSSTGAAAVGEYGRKEGGDPASLGAAAGELLGRHVEERRAA